MSDEKKRAEILGAGACAGPHYPEVTVELLGHDGNAFAILGACKRAARKSGLTDEEIARFYDEATTGNYDDLLAKAMEWFNVE